MQLHSQVPVCISHHSTCEPKLPEGTDLLIGIVLTLNVSKDVVALFSFSAVQVCSWWTTTTRCICGRAGGLRTVKAPAQHKSAGTRTGSVPWRLYCSTVEVFSSHLLLDVTFKAVSFRAR